MSKSSAIPPKEQTPIEALAVLETAKKYGTEVRVSNGNLRFATLWERFVSAISSIPKIFQNGGPAAWEEAAGKALQAKFGGGEPNVQSEENERPVYLTCVTSDSDKTVHSALKNYLAQIKGSPQLIQQTRSFYLDKNTGQTTAKNAGLDDTEADLKFDQITSMTANLMNKGYVYDEALAIARGVSYLSQRHKATETEALEVHRIIFLLKSENLLPKNLKGTALLDYGWKILENYGGKKIRDSEIIRHERQRVKSATHLQKKAPTSSSSTAAKSGVFHRIDNQLSAYPPEALAPLLPSGMSYSSQNNLFTLKKTFTTKENEEFFELMASSPRSESTQFIDPATEQASASSVTIGTSVISLTDLSESLVSDSSRKRVKVIDQNNGQTTSLDYLPPLEFVQKISELTGIISKDSLIPLCDFFCQDFHLNLMSVFLDKNKTNQGLTFLYSKSHQAQSSENLAETSNDQQDEMTLTITKEGNFLIGMSRLQKIDQVIDSDTGSIYLVNQSKTMQAPITEQNAHFGISSTVEFNGHSLASGKLECHFSEAPTITLQIEPALPQ